MRNLYVRVGSSGRLVGGCTGMLVEAGNTAPGESGNQFQNFQGDGPVCPSPLRILFAFFPQTRTRSQPVFLGLFLFDVMMIYQISVWMFRFGFVGGPGKRNRESSVRQRDQVVKNKEGKCSICSIGSLSCCTMARLLKRVAKKVHCLVRGMNIFYFFNKRLATLLHITP